MKHVLLAVSGLAAIAALVLALSAGAAQRAHTASPGPLGLVPPKVNGRIIGLRGRPGLIKTAHAPQPSSADMLTYHAPDQGGPVMHTNKVYAIFWDPNGTLPTAYKNTVTQYFTDVAADSGKKTNVYSVAAQYSDTVGQIQYNSTFEGAINDTTAFPDDSAATSTDGSSAACGTYNNDPLTLTAAQYCMTDAEIQAEVEAVATANDITPDDSTEFFVFTGKHVGSCFDDPTVATGHDCAYSEYCAYHSAFSDGGNDYIYANMPFPNEPFTYGGGGPYTTDCAAGQYPNAHGDTSSTRWDNRAGDEVINVTSHEANESITDPWGTAWWNDNPLSAFYGYENGDLCAWYTPSSSVLGGSSKLFKQYNQVINGDHYYIQGEWSNRNATAAGYSGCMWSYAGASLPPTNVEDPVVSDPDSGTSDYPFVGDTLSATLGTWTGSPTSFKYTWLRCDQNGNNCKTAKTGSATAGPVTYTLVNADDKSTIVLSVVASNKTGASVADESFNTGVVLGEPQNGNPTISGTAVTGQTLTGNVDDGNWVIDPFGDPVTVTMYKYTWLRCDAKGNNCKTAKTGSVTPSVNATKPPTYLLGKPDLGFTIEFSVVAVNSVGSSLPQITDPTSVVTGP